MTRQTYLVTVDVPKGGYLSPDTVMSAIEDAVVGGTPVKVDLQSSVEHPCVFPACECPDACRLGYAARVEV